MTHDTFSRLPFFNRGKTSIPLPEGTQTKCGTIYSPPAVQAVSLDARKQTERRMGALFGSAVYTHTRRGGTPLATGANWKR